MDYRKMHAQLSVVSSALQMLARRGEMDIALKTARLEEAIAAAKQIPWDGIGVELTRVHLGVAKELMATVEARRDDLHQAAESAGVSYRRGPSRDRVDLFDVTYAGSKVRLSVGSEHVCDLTEAGGSQLLERIRDERSKLDQDCWDREQFFAHVKAAHALVAVTEKPRDGWMPVRLIHAAMLLTRGYASKQFLQKPSPRRIQPYSSAQFVYDLARFGEMGWECGGARLKSRSPNMRTASSKACMTIPDLHNPGGTGTKVGHLKVELRGD